jgi:hypothetical protein
VPSAPETSKVLMAPMGFSHVLHLCLQGGGVFVWSGTVTISSSTISGNTAGDVRASLACKSPIALMGDSHFARCLQGGGVYIRSGTVAISSCTISGNTVNGVRAHIKSLIMFISSHRPDGKTADRLASTHACTTAADAPANYSLYVPQRPEISPSPRWEHC